MRNILRNHGIPIIVGMIVIVMGSFVSTSLNLYTAIPHLDKVFHITAGAIIAWFFSRLWADRLVPFNRFERVLICVGLAVMIGYFWEMLEYSTSLPLLSSHETLRHYLYGGDLVDSLGDLMADAFGASLFGLLAKR